MSTKHHVKLGRRVAESRQGFHWYTAGKLAAWRGEFMNEARDAKLKGLCPRTAVSRAREYHHQCMREIAAAVSV